MDIKAISRGYIGYSKSDDISAYDERVPYHNDGRTAPRNIEISRSAWFVIEIREKEDNNLRHKRRPLTVYAANNVNQECWCVLTASLHTLVHVLRNHDINIEDLQENITCDSNCTMSYGNFIPRLRRLKYIKLINICGV